MICSAFCNRLDPSFIYRWFISHILAILAAQDSKKKNQYEYSLATFEGGFFNVSRAKKIDFLLNVVASTLRKVLKIEVRKI